MEIDKILIFVTICVLFPTLWELTYLLPLAAVGSLFVLTILLLLTL